MKRQTPYLLIAFVVMLVGGITLAVLNANRRIDTHQTKKTTEMPAEAGDTQAGVSGKDVTFTVTQGGKLAWQFTAENATYAKAAAPAQAQDPAKPAASNTPDAADAQDEAVDVATITGIRGTYYDLNAQTAAKPGAPATPPQPLATFEAKAGRYDQRNKVLELTGGITVKSASKQGSGQGPELHADTLNWRERDPLITASGNVKLSTQGFGQTTAGRCRFAMDFSTIRLEGGTRTEIQ
ncbi:MAG: LPS export ABC transporter periplasmic protein LptC [Vampirovibrionales bacterium]|nr:LPS export ABC transporter periplasmic protein LptC [Vampirovibrionales bacterium]